jgi:thymidine kinase
MFAGKTTELLKRILWARNGESKAVLVLKTAFDNRYSESKITSHDGLSVDSMSISSFSEVENLVPDAEMVCLDEIQFFSNMEISVIDFIASLLKAGKEVVVTGLDANWKGEAFELTATLMAMADEVVKLKAICSVCGQPAHKTFKKYKDDKEIELGHSDIYEPRCNKHWSA